MLQHISVQNLPSAKHAMKLQAPACRPSTTYNKSEKRVPCVRSSYAAQSQETSEKREILITSRRALMQASMLTLLTTSQAKAEGDKVGIYDEE